MASPDTLTPTIIKGRKINKDNTKHTTYIEREKKEYIIHSAHRVEVSDIQNFTIGDNELCHVEPSIDSRGGTHDKFWKLSTYHASGMFGEVRFLDRGDANDGFPVCKFTLDNPLDQPAIESEFLLLDSLRHLPYVVRVCANPIPDGQDTMVGFRMERLCCKPLSTNPYEKGVAIPEQYRAALRAAVEQLHQQGVAHNDLSTDNIMFDRDGVVKLIDFGFAGRVGELVPSMHPLLFGRSDIPSRFTVDGDLERLEKILNKAVWKGHSCKIEKAREIISISPDQI
ncbi:MAG: histone methyltransferase set2 [Chaenotheca gracillima]|nr:MAG: histone methyltransferase set2 [Chaenotheca gracillima]